MLAVLKVVLALLAVAAPFAGLYCLVRITKRNEGSRHGGGIEGYRGIRRG